MKISRTVAYALQATLQLASEPSDGPIPCSRLAAAGKMPERFLLQILRNLVSRGILQSTRGVDGGYMLGRRPEEISLLEVIEAIEGPMVSAVPPGDGLPAESKSRLEHTLADITCKARDELASLRISDLLPERRLRDDPAAAGTPSLHISQIGARMG